MPFTAYDAALDGIERSRALLAGARSTGRSVRRGRAIRPARLSFATRADMRRMSIVMAVAALDTYMHRLILERAYVHDALPGSLAGLGMPFEELLSQADDAGRAARRRPHYPRPRVTVKRLLRDRLLRETFQSYDDVARALGMAGLSGNWSTIGAEMTPPLQPKALKQRLNTIVNRRNQIVHDGDYARLEKPQNAKCNSISIRDAQSDIDFVAGLIDAIHAVA